MLAEATALGLRKEENRMVMKTQKFRGRARGAQFQTSAERTPRGQS